MFTQIHSSNPTFHLQFCYPSKAQLYTLKNLSKIASYHSQKPLHITLAKDEGGLDSAPKQSSPPHLPPPPPPFSNEDTVIVDQEDVPLEGVIQFEKPISSSRISE
ncbi:hypothetical protein V6N13_057061 [Hibiscus sabdariffa]|uniref:Uncharacterized protein n=2 Tax=Hibiscus sabdariffa TaxID=183260 RepID=A0ABR2NMP6_9ROSI